MKKSKTDKSKVDTWTEEHRLNTPPKHVLQDAFLGLDVILPDYRE